MNRIIGITVALALLGGCRSVTVRNHGQTYIKNADGSPVLVNGAPVPLSKGWEVTHWQHWMVTKADTVKAVIKPNDIEFELNGLDEKSDGDGLAKVVTASLSGAAELATRIGAAIATAGGTACADSISGLVARFVKTGGNVEAASVTCKDGVCTITDGTTTCSDCCYDCAVK